MDIFAVSFLLVLFVIFTFSEVVVADRISPAERIPQIRLDGIARIEI